MSEAGSETDYKERRRATIRESVARLNERLREMTRLEQIAWKLRKDVGENFDPYTQPEREEVEALNHRVAALQEEAAALHRRIQSRLSRDGERDPGLAKLAAALDLEKSIRVEIKPY